MKKFRNRLMERGLSGLMLGTAVFLCPAGYSELFGLVMEKFNLSYDGTRLVFYLFSGLFFLFYILVEFRKRKKD
jgi:hypothetical protein